MVAHDKGCKDCVRFARRSHLMPLQVTSGVRQQYYASMHSR